MTGSRVALAAAITLAGGIALFLHADEPTAPARPRSVVRCVLETAEGSHPVGFEVSGPDGELAIRLPASAESSRDARLIVEDAAGTGQQTDGRFVFVTGDATTGAGNRDERKWSFDATRWGRYAVQVTYALTAGEASAEVVCGDHRASAKLEPTGDARRFRTAELGTWYIAEGGPHAITLRQSPSAGDGLAEIRAVLLVPACEGTQPVQAEDGSITLHGRDATVSGTMLRYEPAPAKQTLGYWTRASDSASWRFLVATPGEFRVEVLQGCGAGQGGSDMVVSLADAELAFEVEETGHFQDFRARVIGTVTIPEAGSHLLTVKPRRIAKTAALDLRQIRLIPAKR